VFQSFRSARRAAGTQSICHDGNGSSRIQASPQLQFRPAFSVAACTPGQQLSALPAPYHAALAAPTRRQAGCAPRWAWRCTSFCWRGRSWACMPTWALSGSTAQSAQVGLPWGQQLLRLARSTLSILIQDTLRFISTLHCALHTIPPAAALSPWPPALPLPTAPKKAPIHPCLPPCPLAGALLLLYKLLTFHRWQDEMRHAPRWDSVAGSTHACSSQIHSERVLPFGPAHARKHPRYDDKRTGLPGRCLSGGG